MTLFKNYLYILLTQKKHMQNTIETRNTNRTKQEPLFTARSGTMTSDL